MRGWKTIAVAVLALLPGMAAAELSTSPNLHIYETEVGGGGLANEQSANLRAGEEISDTAVGSSSSANLTAQSGFNTTADPTLSLTVLDSAPAFGVFSATDASTANGRFQVSNYTSYGYAVEIVGTPPTNGGHTISAITSPTPSQVGREQFGINLVANSAPASFGADPVNAFNGVGTAAPGYDTADNFQFNSGDTVASAPKTSGVTTYNISYLVNVSSITPGGQYQSNVNIICIGFY
jgi:hypothetical protein